MELSDAIKRAALFPESDQPGFPDGHPSRRVEIDGVYILLLDSLHLGLVFPERIPETGVERVVDSVRRLLSAERRKAVWFVPDAASPAGLVQRLLALGMKPAADPRSARLVCVHPPPPGPDDVVARPVATFEEYLATRLVAADTLGLNEAVRDALVKTAEKAWPFHSQPGSGDTFVAIADGEVVACGGARFGRTAVNLADIAEKDARGRRAYRSLVRAQWDAAVARGTPVLTAAAGENSRPILEWLGFSVVGWQVHLADDVA